MNIKCKNKACFYYNSAYDNCCMRFKEINYCGKHIIKSPSLKEFIQE